jgi:hypothetical protein
MNKRTIKAPANLGKLSIQVDDDGSMVILNKDGRTYSASVNLVEQLGLLTDDRFGYELRLTSKQLGWVDDAIEANDL